MAPTAALVRESRLVGGWAWAFLGDGGWRVVLVLGLYAPGQLPRSFLVGDGLGWSGWVGVGDVTGIVVPG